MTEHPWDNMLPKVRIQFDSTRPFTSPKVLLPDDSELKYISLTIESSPQHNHESVVTLVMYAGRLQIDLISARVRELIAICENCGHKTTLVEEKAR